MKKAIEIKKPKRLSVEAIPTSLFKAGEDLVEFIFRSIESQTQVREKMILAITSKIISLAENRIVSKEHSNKEELIKAEADHYLGVINHNCHLSIKHSALLAAAGIDESNSESGDYILLPQDPYKSAEKIYKTLKKKWNLDELGLLITDSHTVPLRRGVLGISLAHWGFAAVIDQRGQKDLFGRTMKMTTVNSADSMAAAAVWCMGETTDLCPLAILDATDVQFTADSKKSELWLTPDEDLYGPVFSRFQNK